MAKIIDSEYSSVEGTVAELSEPIVIVRHKGPWTRSEAIRSRDKIFVFTDNTDRDSGSGIVQTTSRYYDRYGDGVTLLHYPEVTSAVVRGVDNAFPVSTQRWYHEGAKGEAGRWNDEDIDEFRRVVGAEFDIIRTEMVNRALASYRSGPLEVVLPENGLTGGRISAITEKRTPELYAYLEMQEGSLQFVADLYNRLYCEAFSDKAALIDAIGIVRDASGKDLGGPEELWTDEVESLKFSLLSNASWFAAADTSAREMVLGRLSPREAGKSSGSPAESPSEARTADEKEHETDPIDMKQSTTSKKENSSKPVSTWIESLPPSSLFGVFEYNTIKGAIDTMAGKDGVRPAEADMALDDILSNLLPGWNDNLSEKEAVALLKEIFYGFPISVQEAVYDALAEEPGKEVSSAASEGAHRQLSSYYDVIMVGVGKHDRKEVLQMLPPGTDYVVDARLAKIYTSMTKSRSADSWLNRNGFGERLREDTGITDYVRAEALSFTQALNIEELSYSPEVTAQIDAMEAALNSGRQVVVLYDEAAPHQGRIATGLGQTLARRGFEVGYNVLTRDGKLLTVPHESVILGVVHSKGMLSGSVSQIHFTVNGEYTLEEGAALEEVGMPEDRRLRGNWNYGRQFNVDGEESIPDFTKLDLHGLQGYIVHRSDIVFVISTPESYNRMQAMAHRYGRKCIPVFLDTDPTMLRDRDYAREVAAKAFTSLQNEIRYRKSKDASFDESRLHIGILGPNEHETSVKRVTRAASEYELQSVIRKDDASNDEAFILSDNRESENRFDSSGRQSSSMADFLSGRPDDDYELTDVTENDLQVFFYHFFEALEEGVSMASLNSERLAEGRSTPFTADDLDKEEYLIGKYLDGEVFTPGIGTVFSDCNPGTDRAALLAAQSAGKGFLPVLARNCAGVVSTSMSRYQPTPQAVVMKEGKSVYARTMMVNDEAEPYLRVGLGQMQAMLLNPFHLGLGKTVTAALSEDQIEKALISSCDREISGEPGLTPRQIRVLETLGFSNNDILYMCEEALHNGRVIEDTTQFAEFLRFCNDHYFFWENNEQVNISEDRILTAYAHVDLEVEEGISSDTDHLLTVSDGSYPAALRGWKGFTSTEERVSGGGVIDFVYTQKLGDGAVSAEYVPEYIRRTKETVERKEQAPAALHYRGNISLVDSPTVRIAGAAYQPVPAAAGAVRTAVDRLTSNGVTVVTVLRNGTDMLALREALDRGAKVILVSAQPLDYKPYKDIFDEVVDKGGCVISEAAPGHSVKDTAQERIEEIISTRGEYNPSLPDAINEAIAEGFNLGLAEERAEYISTVLGKHLLVIDSKSRDEGLRDGVTSLAAHASNGVSAVSYPDFDEQYLAQPVSGNAQLITEKKARPIKTTGEGLEEVISLARTFSPQWVEAQAEQMEEAKAAAVKSFSPAAAKKDHLVFDVVRCGTDQVFVVPPSMEYVREAVRFTYGEDAVFADSVRTAKNMLYGHPVSLLGEQVNTFAGYTGTQPQADLPYVKHLVFYKDVIFSVDNAPDPAMKLPAQERLRHRGFMEAFRSMVLEYQQDQNIATGISLYKTDREIAAHPHDSGLPAMRFSDGLYTVVTPESVLIYRADSEEAEADTLVASVFLDSDGKFTIEQRDFDLHLEEGIGFDRGKIFTMPGLRRTDYSMSTIVDFAKQLQSALFESSSQEQDEYMLADREKLAEIQQNIESGFRRTSVANIDRNLSGAFSSEHVTLTDPLFDQKENRFAEVDIAKMVGKLDHTIAHFVDKYKELSAAGERLSKQIADLKSAVAGMDGGEAMLDAADSMKLKEEDLAVVNSRMDSTKEAIASLMSKQRRLATASFVALSADGVSDKSIALCVDGELMMVEDLKVTKKEISEKYAPMVATIKEEAKRKTEAFKALSTKVEGASRHLSGEDIETLRRMGRERRLSVPTAEESEVVFTIQKNRKSVICREGLYALTAPDLRIITPFYSEMTQIGGPQSQRLLVRQDDGKYNVINGQGRLMFLSGYDEIRPESEHISAVRRGTEWNHVDFLQQGKLLDEFWSPAVGDFHEGVVRFMGGPEEGENEGKWAFKLKDGRVLGVGIFFDELSDFSEGKAVGRIGKEEYSIDKEGEVFDKDGRNVTDALLDGIEEGKELSGAPEQEADMSGGREA